MGVAGWRGGTTDLAPKGKNPRAATASLPLSLPYRLVQLEGK